MGSSFTSCFVVVYRLMMRVSPVLFKNISNGVYSLPKFLSPGAASLIKRMLIVNPLNRISIHEIMQDDWFKVDLAEYLLPPDLKPHPEKDSENNESKKEGSSPENDEIDTDLVNILSSTMGYEKDEIYESLESSEDTPCIQLKSEMLTC